MMKMEALYMRMDKYFLTGICVILGGVFMAGLATGIGAWTVQGIPFVIGEILFGGIMLIS